MRESPDIDELLSGLVDKSDMVDLVRGSHRAVLIYQPSDDVAWEIHVQNISFGDMAHCLAIGQADFTARYFRLGPYAETDE